MACHCRESDPASPLPPGADGCTVGNGRQERILAAETDQLRYLLTTPVLLSTQALMLMQTSGKRLLGSLAPGEDGTALVLADSDRAEEYVTVNSNKKENFNGYL
jgi:hypothetical protein